MPNNQSPENVGWPACAILGWGTLGGPAAKRYNRRASLGLLVIVAGTLAAGIAGLRPLLAVMPSIGAVYIVWEFRRYLNTVDELARRVLLESIAWTYFCAGIGLLLASCVALAYNFRPNPVYLVCAVALAEGVRGAALYIVARRYQ